MDASTPDKVRQAAVWVTPGLLVEMTKVTAPQQYQVTANHLPEDARLVETRLNGPYVVLVVESETFDLVDPANLPEIQPVFHNVPIDSGKVLSV